MPALKEPIVKNVDLPGITLAQRPSLAAHVVHDQVQPTKAGPGMDVAIQTRIARSDQTGKLDLSLRVINHGSKPVNIREVRILNLAKVANLHLTFADWRPDGLGTLSPKFFFAGIVAPPDIDIHHQPFGFRFDNQEIPAGGSTRFFFLSTNATQFDPKPTADTGLSIVFDAGVPGQAWSVLMPNFLPPT